MTRERAERIIRRLLRLDAFGVLELESRAPKSDEERLAKAFALAIYAKVLSAHDLARAAEVAREAIETIPEAMADDERAIEALAQALRILSVHAYRSGDEALSKEYLESLIALLERSEKPEHKAFLERAKAYKARLFGGEYDAKALLGLDVKDPVVASHAIRAALAANDLDVLEELMRRALLKGTLAVMPPRDVVPALEALAGRRTERAEAVLAFFSEGEYSSDVARFARERSAELRERIKRSYRGTALRILALLEEARERPERAEALLRALNEADLNEGFKKIVESEARIIKASALYDSGEYASALEESLKALDVENIDLLVAAYRLALLSAIRIDPRIALRIADDAYERLKDYRSDPGVSRLLGTIKRLKPVLLLSEGSRLEALIEALKGGKRKKG